MLGSLARVVVAEFKSWAAAFLSLLLVAAEVMVLPFEVEGLAIVGLFLANVVAVLTVLEVAQRQTMLGVFDHLSEDR